MTGLIENEEMETSRLIHFYRPPSKMELNFKCAGTPPGVSFREHQTRSVSWASNEYGERFGKELTGTAAFDLEQLDLENEQDLDKFEAYGRIVYETMSEDSFRWADSSKGSLKDKASSYEQDLRNKHREWTFCLVHKMVYDRARRDKTENVGESLLDLSQASCVRVDEVRAGATVSGVTVKRVLMQNTSDSTFIVQKKMQQMEDASKAEREWLLNMCPKGGGSTYGDGKELFAVRLMVNFLLQENEAAVRELHSLELVHSEGEMGAVLETPLSVENSCGGVLRKPMMEQPPLPSMFNRRCYGCGYAGHLRGDAECTAEDKAVWTGAPERFKRKVNECNQPLPEKGVKELVVTRKVLPIVKRGKAASKVPCRNWLYGRGTCKYAEQCRYSHDAYAGRGVDYTSARVISGWEQQPQN